MVSRIVVGKMVSPSAAGPQAVHEEGVEDGQRDERHEGEAQRQVPVVEGAEGLVLAKVAVVERDDSPVGVHVRPHVELPLERDGEGGEEGDDEDAEDDPLGARLGAQYLAQHRVADCDVALQGEANRQPHRRVA